jgi:DNA ligase 1
MALWAPIAKVWIDQEAAASIGAVDELTVKRFGPLRLLRPERVCEIRFEALAPNARRRSGATLLGAQFSGWCDDCTLADVDELERLQAWWPAAQRSVTDNGS